MAERSSVANKARSRNWLLIKSREWHTWLGVVLSAFIVLVCITGIYLNHADFFQGKDKEHEHKLSGLLTTAALPADLPISFSEALGIAREHWGERPIEKIELKDEHGRLLYKIKAGEGQDLDIDARTGAVKIKDGYRQASAASVGGPMKAGYDWKKVMNDIHTGKIVGGSGKLFVDFVSLVLMTLTISGVYLWVVQKMRKAERDRKAAAAVARTNDCSASFGSARQ